MENSSRWGTWPAWPGFAVFGVMVCLVGLVIQANPVGSFGRTPAVILMITVALFGLPAALGLVAWTKDQFGAEQKGPG